MKNLGNINDNKDITTKEHIDTELSSKADSSHNHNLADLSEKSYNSLTDKPTSMPADGGNADTVDGKHASYFATASGYIPYNDTIQNTNPFGGKKLYISAIDNALHSADRRFVVTATRHSVDYNSETYPKLNPDWVEEYTYTIDGSDYTINETAPSNVVVYDGTTLKNEGSDYNYQSGVVTLLFSPSSSISIFPDWDTPKYIDSPVVNSASSYPCFDGSYESRLAVNYGEYLKIRIMNTASGHDKFEGYPYGDILASYYHTGTPLKTEYRAYNYAYYNHGIGWKDGTFSDYIGNRSSSQYVAKHRDSGNYGRTIMEFIIYGHDTSEGAYTTSISQLEWIKDRPNLSQDGATVTKYGTNSIYGDLLINGYTVKVDNNDVWHAGNDGSGSGLDADKLDNQEGTHYLDRSNHTGNQPASTISDFDTEVSNNSDVDANTTARHSHSNKTILDNISSSGSGIIISSTERTKLSNIEENANNYSLPIATDVVLGGILSGTDITIDASGNVSINDDSHNHIISNIDDLQSTLDGKSDTAHDHNGVYEPADSTILKDADIGVTIQAHDSNTVIDSAYVHTDNNYTTAEKNKLSGIEENATADQTANEILTAIKTVDGNGSGLDAELINGQKIVIGTAEPSSPSLYDIWIDVN